MNKTTANRKSATKNLRIRWAHLTLVAHVYGDKNIRPNRVS